MFHRPHCCKPSAMLLISVLDKGGPACSSYGRSVEVGVRRLESAFETKRVGMTFVLGNFYQPGVSRQIGEIRLQAFWSKQ